MAMDCQSIYSRIFGETVVAKIIHCAPAWSSKQYGYGGDDIPTITELFNAADHSLFKRILNNKLSFSSRYYPEKNNIIYNLRLVITIDN